MSRSVRDWDAILNDMSSGEESDAGDSLNVISVQKNAHRVAALMRDMLVDPRDDQPEVTPPRGMNHTTFKKMQDDIIAKGTSFRAASSPSVSAAAAAAAAGPQTTGPPTTAPLEQAPPEVPSPPEEAEGAPPPEEKAGAP